MNEMYLWFAFGVVLGLIISSLSRFACTNFGTLKIDCSDPDKDTYSIEIDDLDKLAKKSRVSLKVIKSATFSQK